MVQYNIPNRDPQLALVVQRKDRPDGAPLFNATVFLRDGGTMFMRDVAFTFDAQAGTISELAGGGR